MKYLLASLVLLVVSDGLISQYLTRHGLGRQWNPFLHSVVGENHFLLLKLAGALLAALILLDLHRSRPKVGLASSVVCVSLFTGIVYWNLVVFFISAS